MGTTFLHAHAAHADGLQALARVNDELRRARVEARALSTDARLSVLQRPPCGASRGDARRAAIRLARRGRDRRCGHRRGGHRRGVFRRAGAGADAVRPAARELLAVPRPRAAGARRRLGGAGARRPGDARPGRADRRAQPIALPSGYLFGGLASSRARTRARWPTACSTAACRGWPSARDVAAAVARHAGLPAAGPAAPHHRRPSATSCSRSTTSRALPLLLTDLGVELCDGPQRASPRCGDTLVGLTDAGDDGARARRPVRCRHAGAPSDRPRPGAPGDRRGRPRRAGRPARVLHARRRGGAARSGADVQRAARRGRDRRRACRAGAAAHRRRDLRVVHRPRRPHFGAPSAELQIVQRAFGDVPLVGFFAAGEIARHHLYGYTGVLTAFLA